MPGPIVEYWRQRAFHLIPIQGDGQCLHAAPECHIGQSPSQARTFLSQNVAIGADYFLSGDPSGGSMYSGPPMGTWSRRGHCARRPEDGAWQDSGQLGDELQWPQKRSTDD